MAQLSGAQVAVQWQNGVADKAALYALRGVNSGDTAILAEFSVVKQAIVMGTTTSLAFTAAIENLNQITLPAGLAEDAGYLLVYGASS